MSLQMIIMQQNKKNFQYLYYSKERRDIVYKNKDDNGNISVQ